MPDQLNSAQTMAMDTAMNYAAMNYVLKDPAHNFPKLVDWAEMFAREEHAGQLAVVKSMAADPDNFSTLRSNRVAVYKT